jgi:hypothetical protein
MNRETAILHALGERLAGYTMAEGYPDDAGLTVEEGPLTLPEDETPRLIYSGGDFQVLESAQKSGRTDLRVALAIDIEHHTPLSPDLSNAEFREAQRERLTRLAELVLGDWRLTDSLKNLHIKTRTLHPREPGSNMAVQTLTLQVEYVDTVVKA